MWRDRSLRLRQKNDRGSNSVDQLIDCALRAILAIIGFTRDAGDVPLVGTSLRV